MSIDDEIRRKKEKMQAAINAEKIRQAEAKRLRDAFNAAGMSESTPIIRMPDYDLRAIITETMPNMTFNAPKIVRSLPDGSTRARKAINNSDKRERADDRTFDVVMKTEHVDKSTYITEVWFFRNGSVAFSKNGRNLDSIGFSAVEIREKIIETLAAAQMKKSNSGSGSSKSSGGCYIATAVYGSYDCPRVWTLRRYRDSVLRSTWYGRLFIKVYYAVSPTMVRLFGGQAWFKKLWQRKLDKLTDRLNRSGFSDKPYSD